MPADPETITAIQALADRIESKMDRAQERGEESARRIYSSMNEQHTQVNKTITAFGLKLENVSARFDEHLANDDSRFAKHSEEISEAKSQRVGLVKILLGMSASGGLGAVLSELFSRKAG